MEDEEIAITFMKDVKGLCAEVGFHLTEFVSNSKHVLLSIPAEKALSIHWDKKEDNALTLRKNQVQSVERSQW